MTEDTFKLADEVRAENHGEGWDAVANVAVPAEPVVPAEDTPVDASPEVKVDETVANQ